MWCVRPNAYQRRWAKLTLYCILMWTKKLNGKVPRKRFPKDPMPKREMDSIQSHNKENGKTSNFFLMLCDFVCDCVLLIFFASLSSEVGFWIETLLRFCIHIWRVGFYDLIRCAHANPNQSNHERTNTMFAANIKWKWNSIIVYILYILKERAHCEDISVYYVNSGMHFIILIKFPLGEWIPSAISFHFTENRINAGKTERKPRMIWMALDVATI